MLDKLGDYTLERQISGGRFSAVYAARDSTGRTVAIKCLTNPDATLRASFQREIALLRRIKHPNIVPVIDANTVDPLYYVMPFLDGETLEARVRRAGPIPLSEARSIVAQLASALECLHTSGIVHRDVTPSNVMLLRNGSVMLIDFSLANSVGTRGQKGVGTPLYCAPEQWNGDLPTPRADIYALGGVTYFMLSGHTPFAERETAEHTAAQHLRERPKPLHEVNPSVPQAVSRVVMCALERKPEKRWATAEEFARQLLGTASQVDSGPRRNVVPIRNLAVSFSIVALVIGVAWFLLTPDTQVLRPAVMPLPSPTVTLEPEAKLVVPYPNVQLADDLSPTSLPVKASVTPVPEPVEISERVSTSPSKDSNPASTPVPEQSSGSAIELAISAVSGIERWGTPMGPDGCSPPFDDKQPVWRYKVTLNIRNDGPRPLTNWSVRLINQGTPQNTCLLYGSYAPIQVGETRQIEVAAFLRAEPAVQAQIITRGKVWRVCFRGIQGFLC